MKKLTFTCITMCLLWSMTLVGQTDIRGLVIYIDFPDEPATATASQIDDFMNELNFSQGGIDRSVRDYWLQNTNNNIDITHEVVTFRAPNTHAYYKSVDYVTGKQQLFNAALNHVASLHPDAAWWNQFDLVDHDDINTGHEEGRIASVQLLYSQWGSGLLLGNFTHNHGSFTAPNGRRPKKISTSPLKFPSTPAPGDLTTFCHEMGHSVFDWPDLYDQEEPFGKGAGFYTIMKASGPDMPPVGAGLTHDMGWYNVADVSGTQTYTLTFDGDTYVRYINPQDPTELFVIEARKKSTKGNSRLESDKGLVIWHVDNSDANNSREEMTAASHYSHSVEQADGDYDLENNVNQADAGDMYIPGRTFTNSTSPNSKWWDGTSSNLSITNIQISGNQVSFTASVSGGGCTPPNVNISPSSPSIVEGSSVTLSASGASSYSWSNGLGSGSSKTVSPSSTTTYTVTGTSNGCSSTESVTVSVTPSGGGGGGTTIVSRRIASGSDDAEEKSNGSVSLTSTDIELVDDKGNNQTIGLRFTNLNIPQGATIVSADVQFTTDETNTGSTNLTIRGHDSNNSSTFSTSNGSISARGKTSASVSWSPSSWNSVGQAGSNQRTPDISSVIQEVVNRSGFSSSSAISIIITGTGERTAEAYDGESSKAALLTVEYSTGGGGGSCSDPTVSITPSSPTINEGNSVSLSASGASSYSWSNGLGSGSSKTVSPSSTTTYSVTGSVSGGCSDNAFVTVTVIPAGGGGGGDCSNPTELNKSSWSVVSVSDEFTSLPGTNLIDGLTYTQWFTGNGTTFPHEIVIDLGNTYDLSKFAYVPYGSTTGRAADYKLYISSSTNNWGNAVKSGTMANTSSKTTVSINTTTGRYVRLELLSGVTTYLDFVAINELYLTGCVSGSSARLSNKVKSTDVDLSIEESFSVYPNPNNGQISIEYISEQSSDVTIMIYNITGQKILERSYENSENQFKTTIDLKGVSKGIYLMKLISGTKSSERKVVIR